MTNRQVNGGLAKTAEAVLPRPVAVVPVAKPRGKLNTSSHVTTSTYVNQGAVPKSPPHPPRNSSPGDTDTMTKTKAILNEAADAVAKSFAKQTQGINKGKPTYLSKTRHNVNVAHFAGNIKWDFFYGFQTPWASLFVWIEQCMEGRNQFLETIGKNRMMKRVRVC